VGTSPAKLQAAPDLQTLAGEQQGWPGLPQSAQRAGSGPGVSTQVVPGFEQKTPAGGALAPQHSWPRAPHWALAGPQLPSALQEPESWPHGMPGATQSPSPLRHNPALHRLPGQATCPAAPQGSQLVPPQIWFGP
jgi:hypothetical protein